MKTRTFALLASVMLGSALPASAQDGLRLPGRSGSGLDPAFAAGWLNYERDRLVFGPSNWRDAIGFAPLQSMQWSYGVGQHASLGMSVASGRDFDAAPIYGAEARQYGLFGRYLLSPDWSVNAETVSREPGSLFRLQDFRIRLRRQF